MRLPSLKSHFHMRGGVAWSKLHPPLLLGDSRLLRQLSAHNTTPPHDTSRLPVLATQKEMDDTSSEVSASSASSYDNPTVATPSPALTAHHKLLVDAVTKEAVNSQTDLAALYDFSDGSIDNGFLRNLTHISEPAVRCCLVTADQKQYPVSEVKDAHGYNLFLSFNKLVRHSRGFNLALCLTRS